MIYLFNAIVSDSKVEFFYESTKIATIKRSSSNIITSSGTKSGNLWFVNTESTAVSSLSYSEIWWLGGPLSLLADALFNIGDSGKFA